jgi:hypothetical protein
MKYILAALAFVWLAFVGCGKDKFETKPTISIKSISTDEVPNGGNLVINLICTDKEGDVQDSVIIIKRRLNRRFSQTTPRDTLRYEFAAFPDTRKIEIQTIIVNQDIIAAVNPPTIPGSNPPEREPDTLILRIAVRDRAGNTSDTIETKQIRVIR